MVEKKGKYETLRSMGVDNPLQIDRYYITSINFVDVLRIVYDRPKGSFLTSSREYKFPRVTEKSGSTDVPRMHPTLLDAVEELKKILDTKSSKASLAAEIIAEIELLEEEIAMRTECLKVMASKLPDADC
ncbi:MAG: DUF3461 family protein [Woeseiaceae bacterium]|nr:DUF3461 family protein [Woeseiaceae bacterium]